MGLTQAIAPEEIRGEKGFTSSQRIAVETENNRKELELMFATADLDTRCAIRKALVFAMWCATSIEAIDANRKIIDEITRLNAIPFAPKAVQS